MIASMPTAWMPRLQKRSYAASRIFSLAAPPLVAVSSLSPDMRSTVVQGPIGTVALRHPAGRGPPEVPAQDFHRLRDLGCGWFAGLYRVHLYDRGIQARPWNVQRPRRPLRGSRSSQPVDRILEGPQARLPPRRAAGNQLLNPHRLLGPGVELGKLRLQALLTLLSSATPQRATQRDQGAAVLGELRAVVHLPLIPLGRSTSCRGNATPVLRSWSGGRDRRMAHLAGQAALVRAKSPTQKAPEPSPPRC